MGHAEVIVSPLQRSVHISLTKWLGDIVVCRNMSVN